MAIFPTYDPERSGMYTVPNPDAEDYHGHDARISRGGGFGDVDLATSFSKVRQMPQHRRQKLWQIIKEIDAYEEHRMHEQGILTADSDGYPTHVDVRELELRGWPKYPTGTVEPYLRNERKYGLQVAYAVNKINLELLDEPEPARIAEMGRAELGIDDPDPWPVQTEAANYVHDMRPEDVDELLDMAELGREYWDYISSEPQEHGLSREQVQAGNDSDLRVSRTIEALRETVDRPTAASLDLPTPEHSTPDQPDQARQVALEQIQQHQPANPSGPGL